MANQYPQFPSLNIIDATPDEQYAIFATFQSSINDIPIIGGVFSIGCSLYDLDTGQHYKNVGTVDDVIWGTDDATFTQITDLTSFQLRNLFTTPVLVVNAPGAGKFISPSKAILKYNRGTVSYTNPGNTNVVSGSTPVFQFGTGLTAATSFRKQYGFNNTVELLDDTPLYILNLTGNMANGDGTVRLYVTYQIQSSAV